MIEISGIRTPMCGIFGFMLSKTVPIEMVFKVLQKLEVHQYPQEPNPLGGYGAGVAVLLDDGSVISDKVGNVEFSPARSLGRIWKSKVREVSVLISHVRRPSPEFMQTAASKETAQPYVVHFDPDLTIVSVHNGKVENYEKLRAGLAEKHVFESEKVQLIDSEIIPHCFGELLFETDNVNRALDEFLCRLQGSNTICILQAGEKGSFMHFVHRGQTRGLIVWTNDRNEVVFSSRREVLTEEFSEILARSHFKEKTSIDYHEEAALKLSFSRELE